MELRHLRYFVTVAEELHFRRAAERLNISQPPLSLQIAQLERELGGRLFDRSSQRVALTAAGRLFLHHARDILERVAEASRDVRLATNGEAGELRVAFTQSSEFLHILPETIHRFRSLYPKVTFALEQMKSADQIDAITERRLDLGISRRPTGQLPATVELTRLYDDPMVLAVHSENPLAHLSKATISMARDMPFIVTPNSAASGLRDSLVQLCKAAGFTPRIAQEAREVPTMLGLVAAGVGVAVVPALARHMGMRGVVFLALGDTYAKSSLYMSSLRKEPGRLITELKAMLLAASGQ